MNESSEQRPPAIPYSILVPLTCLMLGKLVLSAAFFWADTHTIAHTEALHDVGLMSDATPYPGTMRVP